VAVGGGDSSDVSNGGIFSWNVRSAAPGDGLADWDSGDEAEGRVAEVAADSGVGCDRVRDLGREFCAQHDPLARNRLFDSPGNAGAGFRSYAARAAVKDWARASPLREQGFTERRLPSAWRSAATE